MAITRSQQAKQLLALGGRIGLQEGGGIEQRLEQLGGDVTSAEQMLQGINQRLKTAESSLGSGGGLGGLPGMPTDLGIFGGVRPVDMGGVPQPIPPQANLPDRLIPAQPNDPKLFGYDPRGIFNVQDAFSAAQQAAQEQRKSGFAGKVKLPGEMSFEDFSNLYDQGRLQPLRAAGSDSLTFPNLESLGKPVDAIPMRGGPQMMRSSGIPAAGYADGGMLVKPGFGGKRQGYKGGQDMGAGSSGMGSGQTGNTGNTGGNREGRRSSQYSSPDRTAVDRGSQFSRNVARQQRITNIERLIDRPTFGFTDAAKYNIAPPGLRAFQGLFTGPKREFNQPTRQDEGGKDMPLWMQLGYNSEAEYNAAMGRGVATSTPVESDPPVNLNRMAYRLMAEGGVAMDDEPRQAYGLGSIVKKATRAIKKVAKSDLGKIALLYAATGGLGNLAQGQGFFTNFTSPTTFLGGAKNIFTKAGAKNILFGGKGASLGGNLGRGAGIIPEFSGLIGKGGQLTGAGALRGLAAVSTLPLLGIGVEDEEEQPETSPYLTAGLDIEGIRANPRAAQGRAFRLQIAEGGSTEKEPVAKKVMPLIDMGGKEKDYRETGGFVDMGRMEKADDVPARLSKNELVFTADAVRNAGDGSVDKGAEVMYNMMKNLEAGGEVSEESQGLEGARKMFKTSQRLEEVL